MPQKWFSGKYIGEPRYKSDWLKEMEKRPFKINPTPQNIERVILDNITIVPHFTHNPRDLNSLFKWITVRKNEGNCLRWDGPYYGNKPYLPLLKKLPDEENPRHIYYMDNFLFYIAFGPLPTKKRLEQWACDIGVPRGIDNAAWCVNPYHKSLSKGDDPRTNRRWLKEEMDTLAAWRAYFDLANSRRRSGTNF